MEREKSLKKLLIPLFIVLALLVAVVAVVTPVLAYYLRSGGKTDGSSTPAEPSEPTVKYLYVDKEITEVSFSVEDKGYPVFVRAAIVVTWREDPQDLEEDEDGAVYYVQPVEGEDYDIDFNESGWTQLENDFYYCVKPVASGGTTTVFIDSCALSANAEAPDGYVLCVEVIVQTIQAIGATDSGNVPAWKDAWGPVWNGKWGEE